MQEKHNAHSNNKITRNAGTVAFFTAISRLAGLARDVVVVHLFGASRITDIFYIAFTIPNVMRRLVAEGALTVSFVPVYTDVLHQEGRREAKDFFRVTLGALILVLLAMVGLGLIFAKPLVLMLASGLADEPVMLDSATLMTRQLFPYLFFISLVALCMGVLNAHQKFATPAAAPILLNLSMISCMALFYEKLGIEALVLGVVVGGVIQLLLQLPSLRQLNLLVYPKFNFSNEPLRKLGKLLLPAVFGIGVYQLNIVVLRQLGSYLPAGQITHYYNADRLMQLALGIFAISIATAALPSLSSLKVKKDYKGLVEAWVFTTRLTNFITIPAALGLAGCAFPIVCVLYFHGAYTADDVLLTANAAMGFAPGLVAIAIMRTTVQVFYSLEDMKTPVYVGAATVVINLFLGILLLRYEVFGLAISFSIACAIQCVMLYALLTRKLRLLAHAVNHVSLLWSMLWQLGTAILAVSAARWTFSYADFYEGPSLANVSVLFVGIMVAVLIYFALAYVMKSEELKAIVRAFKK